MKRKYLKLILCGASLILVACGGTTSLSSAASSISNSSSVMSSATSEVATSSSATSVSSPATSETTTTSNTTTSVATNTSSTSSSVTSSIVDNSHDITVQNDENVTVNVIDKAEEGDVVTITLSYDQTKVAIDSVKANDVECGESGDNYYFVMPDSDVTIVITSHEIKTKYQLTCSSNIDLLNAEDSYAAGDNVTFKVAVKPGFSLESLKIIENNPSADEETLPQEVEFTVNEGVYSFVMPNYNVIVEATVSRNLYEISYEGSEEYVSSLRELKVGEKYDSSITEGVATYGSTITVNVKDTEYGFVTGVKIVETNEILDDFKENYGTKSVSFTMPHRNITLEVLYEPYIRHVEVVNADTLTVKTYSKDEVTNEYTETDEFIYEDTVYLKVEGVSENVVLYSLTASYIRDGSSYVSSIDILENGLNEEGYYSFTMPDTDPDGDVDGGIAADTVVVNVAEKDVSKYQGEDFVGTYLGLELWNGNDETSFSDNYSFTIDGSGIFTYRSNEVMITSFENNIAYGEGDDDYVFAYSDKIIYSSYRMTSLDSDDNLFAVKKQEGDEDALYTVEANHFNDERYQVFLVRRDGEFYAAAFVDCQTGDYYLDAEIEFIGDSNSVINLAEGDGYKVIVNGETICTVSNIGGELKVLDNVVGEYSNTDAEHEIQKLTLDGVGGASINDETVNTMTYVINEDGTLDLYRGGENWKIQLSEGTFTILSYVEAANDFVGYTYSGSFYSDSLEETYNLELSFLTATQCDFRIYSGMYDYVGGDSASSKEQTYTISEDGKTITVVTYGYSVQYTITITVNDDGTLLVNDDADYRYTCSNTVLTRN